MKIRTALLVLYLLFINVFVSGNSAITKITSEQLMQRLPKIGSIECKFKQEKILKNIQKPIYSNGNFKFKKNEGVYFETLYPVKSSVSYTNKDYKQINDIILAISNKKYSKLDKEFDFFYTQNGNIWTVKLKPKAGVKSEQYIEFIEIEGDKIINKIVILTKSGNKTTQWFMTN